MFFNLRLLIVAMFASVVALTCELGVFAALRVNHDPLARMPADTVALQLVADDGVLLAASHAWDRTGAITSPPPTVAALAPAAPLRPPAIARPAAVAAIASIAPRRPAPVRAKLAQAPAANTAPAHSAEMSDAAGKTQAHAKSPALAAKTTTPSAAPVHLAKASEQLAQKPARLVMTSLAQPAAAAAMPPVQFAMVVTPASPAVSAAPTAKAIGAPVAAKPQPAQAAQIAQPADAAPVLASIEPITHPPLPRARPRSFVRAPLRIRRWVAAKRRWAAPRRRVARKAPSQSWAWNSNYKGAVFTSAPNYQPPKRTGSAKTTAANGAANSFAWTNSH
jgi:hypothetical protein